MVLAELLFDAFLCRLVSVDIVKNRIIGHSTDIVLYCIDFPSAWHSRARWTFSAESLCLSVDLFVYFIVNTITSERLHIG